MDKFQNPFTVSGYTQPAQFCGREKESEILMQAWSKGKHATLTSLRNAGKTTLISHVFERMKSRKGVRTFQVDVYAAQSQAEFLLILASQTLGKLDDNHMRLMREMANYFTHLRPMIRYDALSGSPAIGFTLDHTFQFEHTLEQVFTYLDRSGSQTVLAIDEFQQILTFREKNTEAIVHALLRKTKNLRVVFSASTSEAWKKSLSNAFYQQTELLHLEFLEHEEYVAFILHHFTEGKRKLSQENAERLVDWCRGHTRFVQTVCNRLYARDIKQPDAWYIERLFQDILQENQSFYFTIRNLLTLNQWLLLKGIARENGARMVMGAEFVRRYELGTPSSVQTALLALQEKEMVYEEDGRWWLQDVFLSRWLEA